jgi:hypothetical protein
LDKGKRIDVERFLAEFRCIAESGRGIDLIPRAATNQTLVELGLTAKTSKQEILDLTPEDYCAGPEADQDQRGTVWLFGRVIQGQEVYIKLKIARAGGVKIAKCISFHIAEHRLRYPLRGK